MKKRFFGTLLTGALLVASMSTFVSCKDDYDDSELRQKIEAQAKLIDQINSQITAGGTISNVQPSADGVSITMSDGKTYTVGKDGKDGKDGKPGTVWTINEVGYWCVDYGDGAGVIVTEYKAVAQDGTAGTPGPAGQNGKDGQDGQDGLNGDYYVPNAETGCFDVYKWDAASGAYVKSATTISFMAPGSVTAVMDNDNLTLFGVKDKDGNVDTKGIVIALSNNLRGLVFEKDALGRVYVDGVPGIRVASFKFKALSAGNTYNLKTETWQGTGNSTINPATFAYYHVNPANANVEELKNLKYVVKPNAEYKVTRAKASGDFAVTGTFESFENGILKVKVDVKGLAATDEYISVGALQATKKNDETVTSDYTCFFNEDMDAMRFVNKKENVYNNPKHFYHFRRMIINDNEKDDKYYQIARIKDMPVWDTQDLTDYDIQIKWNATEPTNLDDYVGVHVFDEDAADEAKMCASNAEANLKDLDLHIDYEVVGEGYKDGKDQTGTKYGYLIGENLTNQANFITLNKEERTIIARSYGDGQGSSAVGKTPIIRAILKDASNHIIEVAYIKVLIVEDPVEEKPIDNSIPLRYTKGTKFSCAAPGWLEYSVEEINTQLYNQLFVIKDETKERVGVTRDLFMQKFNLTADSYDRGNRIYNNYANIGEVTEIKDETGQLQGSTHIIKWRFSAEELWKYAGQEVYHYLKYVGETADGAPATVIVKLITAVDDVKKAYDIEEAKYIGEYWNADKTIAYFNVDVPTSTNDANPDNCLFENDANSPFVTYPKGNALEGILKVDDYVTSIKYFFHSKNSGSRKVGDKTYTFDIRNNGLELWASKGGAYEKVAEIDNSGTYQNTTQTQLPNVIILNKNNANDDALAKQLLNTNEFQVFIMATGYICGQENQAVKITFKGEDYFVAQYVKPINFLEQADKEFIDGVDFGEVGSYLNIKNIVRPIDWRNRQFTGSYSNYWGYYGPFKVSFTNTEETAKIKLNGTWQAIPATIDVNYADPGSFAGGNDEYGYITYKNNGTTLNSATEMQVRVWVTYGWGKILTPWITVKVNTISSQE